MIPLEMPKKEILPRSQRSCLAGGQSNKKSFQGNSQVSFQARNHSKGIPRCPSKLTRSPWEFETHFQGTGAFSPLKMESLPIIPNSFSMKTGHLLIINKTN